MKKSILLASILTGSTLVASAANASDNLADLFYIPSQGDIISTTSVSRTSGDSSTTGSSVTVETTTTEIREKIQYGVNDRLNIGLNIAHQDSETEFKSGASQLSLNSDGITNPEISAEYRAANQDNNGLVIDLRASYAPDLFDSEYETINATTGNTFDGTVANGRDVYKLGFSLGRSNDAFAYKINVDSIHNGNGETSSAEDSSVKIQTNSSTDLQYGIQTQYRVSDQISIDAGITHTEFGSYVVNESSATRGENSTDISVGANFAIDPKKSVVSVSYTNTDSGTSSTDNEEDKFSVALKYRF